MSTPYYIARKTPNEAHEWDAVFVGYDGYIWSAGKELVKNYYLFYQHYPNGLQMMVDRIFQNREKGLDSISQWLFMPTVFSLFSNKFDSEKMVYMVKEEHRGDLRKAWSIPDGVEITDYEWFRLSNMAPRNGDPYDNYEPYSKYNTSVDVKKFIDNGSSYLVSYTYLFDVANQTMEVYSGTPFDDLLQIVDFSKRETIQESEDDE